MFVGSKSCGEPLVMAMGGKNDVAMAYPWIFGFPQFSENPHGSHGFGICIYWLELQIAVPLYLGWFKPILVPHKAVAEVSE